MERSLDQRFGDALRALREMSGKTQEEFNIGRTYLSELERGLKTPSLETIVKLADELGISPVRLVELATASSPVSVSDSSLQVHDVLNGAIASLTPDGRFGTLLGASSLASVQQEIRGRGIDLAPFLAQAALVSFRKAPGRNPRERRSKLTYLVADKRSPDMLQYARDAKTPWAFTSAESLIALNMANTSLELADDVLGMNGIPFYELLGTRNLGSFVGAVFAYSLRRVMPDRLMVNGHQDGYPDLCALTDAGKKYIEKIREDGVEDAKKSWAFYPEGGIEVKTTCGAVPTATKKRKKPQIGDQRTGVLTGAGWKAHHRETNRLLGLFWDFIDGVPTILALFYRNDLTKKDWGEVIVPTADEEAEVVKQIEEGMEEPKKKRRGRTTSVSIMTGESVKKMAKGWVVLPEDSELLSGLCKKSVFDLGLSDVTNMASNISENAQKALRKLDGERLQKLAKKEKSKNSPSRKKK